MKNKTKKVLIFVMLLIFLIVLKTPDTYSIYKSDLSTTVNLTITDASGYYTLSFDSQGGNSIPSKTVSPNTSAGTLQVPTKTNFNFLGWYDENGNKVDHNTVVTRSMELTAHWQKIVCKKVPNDTALHREICEQSNGNGCRKAGYDDQEEIKYGNVPNDNSPVLGDAYDCDVDNDGTYNPTDAYGKYTERFYYIRQNTTDDTAVLVFYTSYDEEGRVDSQHRTTPVNGGGSYIYTKALTYLPVNTGTANDPNNWDNPELVEFDSTKHNTGRLLTLEDVEASCGTFAGSGADYLYNCQFLLENSRFQKSSYGRAGIWTEINSNDEYYRIQTQTLVYEKKTESSENTVRPVIEIPMIDLDGYMDEDEFTISFNVNGGDSLTGIRRYRGQTIGSLPTPTRNHYYFVNWYSDPELTTLVDPTAVVDSDITLYAAWDSLEEATVTFVLNGGTGVPSSVVVTLGHTIDPWQVPTKAYNTFEGWYLDQNCLLSPFGENDIVEDDIILYAKWEAVSGVAAVNGEVYPTLQDAINAVPKNGENYTVVTLLQSINLDGMVTIKDGRKVELDIGEYAITRSTGVIFSNYATLKIKNGTITTSGSNRAYAIDNKSTGELYITGGTLSSTNTSSTNTNVISSAGIVNITGGRINCDAQAAAIDNNGGTVTMSGGEIVATNTAKCQAMYNNGGTINISGNAYLESNTSNRYTLHNFLGTMNITGGTIVANNSSAVYNKADQILTIGNDDGTINTSTPILQGKTYGLELESSATATVSDGLFRSLNNSVAINATNSTVIPQDTEYVTNENESVSGVTYHKAYLISIGAQSVTVTFDRNDGTGNTTTRNLTAGSQVGELTAITRTDYIFVGWFTLADGGTQITDPTTIINSDVTYYAHWIANINNATISPSSVSVMKGSSETLSITGPSNLEGYTLTSNSTSIATVTSAGVVTGVGVGSTTITMTGITSSETITINVSVSPLTHTIIYNSHGGEPVANSIVNYNETISPFVTTTQTGYLFDGWFTSENGGTEVTSSTPITSNMTLHAHWTADITNATISPNPLDIKVGHSYTITVSSSETIESCTFTSNNTNIATVSNLGTVTGLYEGTTTITIEGSRSHKIETVTVNVSNYNLTFNHNDGTGDTTVISVVPGNAIGALLPQAPTRNNYRFDGWFTSENDGIEVTAQTEPDDDYTYYGIWTGNINIATFPTDIEIAANEDQLISPTSAPDRLENYTLSSNDTSVVTVLNNTISAVSAGTATITITGEISTLTKTINVVVTPPVRAKVTFINDDVTNIERININTSFGQNMPTTPTKSGYIFVGWFIDDDIDEQFDSTTIVSENINVYAKWTENTNVVRIKDTYYENLQTAFDDVPTDGTETEIVVLKNFSDYYASLTRPTIEEGKNAKIIGGDYEVSCSVRTDKNLMWIKGTLTIESGTFTCGIQGKATLEVYTTGIINITGGTVSNTNDRAAIYNTGTVNVSGDAFITSQALERPTIQNAESNSKTYMSGGLVTSTNTGCKNGTIENQKGGSIISITGGTVKSASTVSTSGALVNKSGVSNVTITIGTSGNGHSLTSPIILGKLYGVNSNINFSFYDGKIGGETAAVSNISKIANYETNYEPINPVPTETIDGNTYNVLYYVPTASATYTVHLNVGSGSISQNSVSVGVGNSISANQIPTPTRTNYTFAGWVTTENGSTPVTFPIEPSAPGETTIYAKWTYNSSTTPVLHTVTSDAMTTYFNNVASWVAADADDPTNSDNDSTNDHYNFFNSMNTNFTTNSCSSCNAANNCTSPTSGTYCEQPKGYNTGFNQNINVYPYVNNTKGNTTVSYITVENGVIYNMIPGESYYWEVANDNTIYGVVTATGNRRTLYSPIRNLRDLGGMSVDTDNDGTPDGTLKYGILYRGAQNTSGQTGVTSLTKLGINREIDLRADGDGNNGQAHLPDYDVDYDDSRFEYPEFQITGSSKVTDPSDDETKGYKDIVITNYIVNPTTTAYFDTAHLDNYKAFKAVLKQVMRQVADGDSIYFHCTIGTDRTGTLAYFLEGLLGVPLEERLEDYELSYYYGLQNRHRFHNLSNKTFPFQLSWNSSINPRFEAMYKSYDTYQKIYEFYTYIPEADDATVLANFRAAMINSNS